MFNSLKIVQKHIRKDVKPIISKIGAGLPNYFGDES